MVCIGYMLETPKTGIPVLLKHRLGDNSQYVAMGNQQETSC